MRSERWIEEERLLERPLRRSRRSRMVCGVCGGLAEWLGWDPTVVRLAFVLLAIVASPVVGVGAYVVLCLLVPEEGAGHGRRARGPLEPL
jgi:phage shock protein PspC (stress-responsive transcriptional regulator)